MEPPLDAARDLRLGLLALELGMIDEAALLGAIRAWCGTAGRPLAEHLLALGAIDAAGLGRLEGLAGPAGPEATVAYTPSAPGVAGPAPAGGPRYRAIRPHARGGLGAVFVAIDPELNREVALKELRPEHAFDPASQARFLLEAELTGRLEHPGIVPVYGLGRHPDGRPFYAMRLIEGQTLKAAIARFHGPEGPKEPAARALEFGRLLRSVVDACNAVAYAHDRGVIHRDLKPENIMLGRFGETLVVDWGVAKPVGGEAGAAHPLGLAAGPGPDGSLTRAGAVVGTPRYMSPEQAEGQLDRVGPASDVYGLGATLYCVLVGHAPFPDGDYSEVLGRVRRGIFPAPRRANRAVDPGLEAICLRAMARDPGARHPSALALAVEIEAWLADVRSRGEQAEAEARARRAEARLGFERALARFGAGRDGEGVLWLARALESAAGADPPLERAIRAGLCGWHGGARRGARALAHGSAVTALAFSPDGRGLATAGGDGSVRIWDVATGMPLAGPFHHGGPVARVAYRSDGRALATAGVDGTVRLWDAQSGAPIGRPVALAGPVAALAFGPGGARLAVAAGPGSAWLRDGSSGRAIRGAAAHDCAMNAAAFAADGTWLALGGADGRVRLREPMTGKSLGPPMMHDGPVSCLAAAPGDRLLVGGASGRARLWEVGRAEVVAEFDHRRPVAAAAWIADAAAGPARVVVAGAEGSARLWDAAGGGPIGEPMAHDAPLAGLAVAPDGATIATACRSGRVRLWDTATALPVGPPLEHRGTVAGLAFSPDGRRLAVAVAGAGGERAARCYAVPEPVAGTPELLGCWARVETGLDLDAGDAPERLDPLVGLELRRRIGELGGPPIRPAGARERPGAADTPGGPAAGPFKAWLPE